MGSSINYTAPSITELGTVRDMTLQAGNKIGASSNHLSSLGLTGSIQR